ncbi:8521_t:CDS:2 [Funneliformis mosseae]|uniref:8521_t:CDS:1 n=1 Tax=Funneliformis mosseae TaxID=27381 RepID=A0A9N9C1P7_FUNMO|nr:8521_t:CDS:2 [Funneliformis mosseae]
MVRFSKEISYQDAQPQSTILKPMQGMFRKGVQYNINRLQGDAFKEDYVTTSQIQVANIQWNYNQTNDVIKVEIWDVVDKGINPTSSSKRPNLSNGTGLKIENDQVASTSPVQQATELSPDQLTLDAATINVYRNTHGIILLFDITKTWTFDYAIKELKSIPVNMAVLLLGNFSDLSSQRAIPQSQVYQAIADCNRLRVTEYPTANMVRYVETSMLNGFGLEYIHKYFGVPFLQLQRDILRQQLELKTKELAILLDTLDNCEQIPSSARKLHSISDNVDNVPESKRIFHKLEMEQDMLVQEKSSIKDQWDKDYQDFSLQESGGEITGDIVEPISPKLNLAQSTSTSLKSKGPKAATPNIAIIEEFDAGQLEDDFFDDTPDPSFAQPPNHPPKVEEQEQDDLDLSNPMVTADEDLVGDVSNDMEETEDGNKTTNIRQPPSFNDDLNDVWKRQNSNASALIVSDSSDDDLITGAKQMNLLERRPSNAASLIEKSRLSQELRALREESNFLDPETSKYPEHVLSMINNPYLESDNMGVSNSSQGHHTFVDSSFDMEEYTPMTFGTPSAYEEIGEGQDNPWLERESNQQVKDTNVSSTTHQSRKEIFFNSPVGQNSSTDHRNRNSESAKGEMHNQHLHLHHPKSFDEELISSSPWGGLDKSNIQSSQNTEDSLLDTYIKNEVNGGVNIREKKTSSKKGVTK